MLSATIRGGEKFSAVTKPRNCPNFRETVDKWNNIEPYIPIT